MIMAAVDPSADILPLFVADELREIDQLQEARDALCRRIMALPRHSHRRVVLQDRLAELTARQLDLEVELRARG